jgi:hypothetical protein
MCFENIPGDKNYCSEKSRCAGQGHSFDDCNYCNKDLSMSTCKGTPDYLENNVIRFVHLLRNGGIRIGSSEVIDALRALQMIDIANRQVK